MLCVEACSSATDRAGAVNGYFGASLLVKTFCTSTINGCDTVLALFAGLRMGNRCDRAFALLLLFVS